MKSKAVVLGVLGILLLTVPLFATEGKDQYPNGAESWGAGMLPPPSTLAYLNYFQVYCADLKNGSGNTVSIGGKTASVCAEANAFRPVFMSKLRLFGGNVGWYVVIPVVHQSMTLGNKYANGGIGDITVQPFFLAWHFPKKSLHIAAVTDFNLPTGNFNASDPASIGNGYVDVEPAVAITYLPRSGWEVSTKMHYDIPMKNTSTDYKSGQNFHFDYLVGKHIKHWGVGAGGYFLKQTTDDLQHGQVVAAAPGMWDTGRRGQVFAAGPNITYNTSRGFSFIASYSREMAVQNRFGGNKLTVRIVIPTHLSLFPKME
jgi:hypothetical protein